MYIFIDKLVELLAYNTKEDTYSLKVHNHPIIDVNKNYFKMNSEEVMCNFKIRIYDNDYLDILHNNLNRVFEKYRPIYDYKFRIDSIMIYDTEFDYIAKDIPFDYTSYCEEEDAREWYNDRIKYYLEFFSKYA